MVEAPGRGAGRARQARGVVQPGRALQGASPEAKSIMPNKSVDRQAQSCTMVVQNLGDFARAFACRQ